MSATDIWTSPKSKPRTSSAVGTVASYSGGVWKGSQPVWAATELAATSDVSDRDRARASAERRRTAILLDRLGAGPGLECQLR